MCTLSIKIDDQVVDRFKPLFDGDSAMNRWIEIVLRKAMLDYMEQQYANRQNQSKENVRILLRLKELEGDPDAFFKMGGILGKPREGFSWDELREEAISEKYGI